ncbi:class E sortase [Streptomyces murinus]|uniref:class E sortase n=1 Tax=Streptomyces murinus TaxID=33900 RepID=UPI000A1EBC3F|nr:class E sortase [Streptomyces murinus]WDO08161.1 class E sortase [Streptomyces murinus]
MRTAAGVRVVGHGDRRRCVRRRRILFGGGELLVTAGVLLLLLVAHQLWWTNREARQGAERKVAALEREWGSPSSTASGESSATSTPAVPQPSRQPSYATVVRPRPAQAYAVLVVPRLGLRVPVAEGVGKADVLDKGYVGHYPGTQQPGQEGNFALAGHRNTHGEPFRYLPRLRRGDAIEVETGTATYTYDVDSVLPRTSAMDFGVVRAVPRSLVRPGYGYREPGRYLTLTTCTPEFTSRYRMAVWGKLVSVRPR